jgi:hypothetical protein
MLFRDEYSDSDTKVHLNISYYADGILENDACCFSYKEVIKRGTIINKIILNYNLEGDINKFSSRNKDVVYKYRPSREVIANICVENVIEPPPFTIGIYLKALVEEYALLPYYKREEIFFKDRVDDINDCIEAGYSLKISYRGNNLIVIPYKIEQDKWSSFNYLLAATKDNGILTPYNARIAFIEKLDKVRKKEPPLTKQEKGHLEKDKKKKGIQFIRDETGIIKVLLTKVGQNMYKHMLFLRPNFTDIKKTDTNEAIYSFNCTERQIEYYFVKFGKEAIVLEPVELRDRIYKIYEDAVESYKQKNEG